MGQCSGLTPDRPPMIYAPVLGLRGRASFTLATGYLDAKSQGGSLKLLLTSAGIKNASIQNALVDLLGKPIADSNALCIPTARYGHPQVSPDMAWTRTVNNSNGMRFRRRARSAGPVRGNEARGSVAGRPADARKVSP